MKIRNRVLIALLALGAVLVVVARAKYRIDAGLTSSRVTTAIFAVCLIGFLVSLMRSRGK
jgi:hypothetical protein